MNDLGLASIHQHMPRVKIWGKILAWSVGEVWAVIAPLDLPNWDEAALIASPYDISTLGRVTSFTRH
ncbi:MAG: hypothetical protein PUP92_28015 [Rhizonema sp. PD38]|nr:hypothetical protein [Rhizonema sp. PD38]